MKGYNTSCPLVLLTPLPYSHIRMHGIAFDLRRHGLSELTAALLICAITLVVGAALYGLYFSGQNATSQNAASQAASFVNSAGGNPANSFYATAQVSAAQVSCTSRTGACSILLTNSGSANTNANGCYFGGFGQGALSPNPATVPAGGSVEVVCTTSNGVGGASGAAATGSISLSNGALVEWVGTWQ